MRIKNGLALLPLIIVPTARAQTPAISANGVVNAATFQANEPLAPGGLMSIFGTALASSLANADSVPFSTSLAGVSVKLTNGADASQAFDAPISYVQPDDPTKNVPAQINAQVPWSSNVTNGPLSFNVVVTRNGVPSQPMSVTIGPFSPGIFAFNGQRAIVANVDGTFTWPTGLVAGAPSHPAKPGDIVIIYATGLGAVDSPVQDGNNSIDKLRNTLVKPVVLIGGASAVVQFSGLSPQFPGVNQINAVVPNIAASDSVPIQLQIGGITTPALTIAVGQ